MRVLSECQGGEKAVRKAVIEGAGAVAGFDVGYWVPSNTSTVIAWV